MMPRERVNLEPGYVLHSREYRDTSRILEVFTQRHGRLTLFARGARGPKSKLASLLMPFRALLLSWSGRGDAAQLTSAEPHVENTPLPSRQVMSGFYLNELIMTLITRHDPQPALFDDYAEALRRLASDATPEPVLRIFEKRLLVPGPAGASAVMGPHYKPFAGARAAACRCSPSRNSCSIGPWHCAAGVSIARPSTTRRPQARTSVNATKPPASLSTCSCTSVHACSSSAGGTPRKRARRRWSQWRLSMRTRSRTR